MATVEDRIRGLLAENIEADGKPPPVDLDFDTGLTELGVPSTHATTFARAIAGEFGITFDPTACTVKTLAGLVRGIKAQTC